jgi:hypothetical protein
VLDDSVVMDAKTARRAWDAHKESWSRAYFVLYNNGKLAYYDSAGAAALPADKRVAIGEVNLRLFAVQEVAEEFDEEKEGAGAGGKGGKAAKAAGKKGKAVKPVEMKIE